MAAMYAPSCSASKQAVHKHTVPETITPGVKKNVTNIEQPRGGAEIEHSSLLLLLVLRTSSNRFVEK